MKKSQISTNNTLTSITDQLIAAGTYRRRQTVLFVHAGRKQDSVDFMDDPISADAVTLRHVRLVDEDCVLKIIQSKACQRCIKPK